MARLSDNQDEMGTQQDFRAIVAKRSVLALLTAGVVWQGALTLGPAPASAGPEVQATCPSLVEWNQGRDCVGQTLWVAGLAVNTVFDSQPEAQPTFLDLGLPAPDPARFTIVIWFEDRWKFEQEFGPPENYFYRRNACVHGTITTFHGVPQIAATEPSQLKICE